MAKKSVVELRCDRCTRIELIDPKDQREEFDLVLTFEGTTIQYEDLCSKCRSSVANYIKNIRLEAKEETDPATGPSTATTSPALGAGTA